MSRASTVGCRGLGTTLEAVAQTNILKLQARYPDRFTEEHALVRDLDAERTVLEESTITTMLAPRGITMAEMAAMSAAEKADLKPMTPVRLHELIVDAGNPSITTRPIQLGAGLTLSKSGSTWSIKSAGDLIVAQTKPGSTYLEEIESIDTGTLFAAQQILNTLAK